MTGPTEPAPAAPGSAEGGARLWLVRCVDLPDAAARRVAARPAHSARLRTAALRPLLYGPLVTDDGATAIGSMFVLRARSREDVERFVAEDPFRTEQVWGEVTVSALAVSSNSPVQLPEAAGPAAAPVAAAVAERS